MSKRGRPPHPDVLTPREWEVLGCIREGLGNEEIAERLAISLDGVKYHVTEILSKLGLENRHDAARWQPARPGIPAAAPLFLWRKLHFGWLSPAIVVGLGVTAAAGMGLLVWALVVAGNGSRTTTEALGPTPAPYNGPLAAYAVVALSSDPLAPLSLKAIDPFTGAAVLGRKPIELGHDGVEALSPDGATIALGWAAADTGGSGPNRLSFLDTATWQKRDTNILDGISQLFWSPDGSEIYVVTSTCFACEGKPTRTITVDARTGKVKSEQALPYGPQCYCLTQLSSDGQTLYVFGHAYANPDVVTNPPPPHLAAVDVHSGSVRADLEFSDVLFGWRSDKASGGTQYSPAWTMSPDGQSMYIAYPDSDRIAIVDLPAMRVERTVAVERQQTSLMGRFLSLFADKAEAKGGPTNSASLYISADGRRLYYSRSAQHLPADALGNYPTTTVGPWVLDPGSLHVTKELKPGAMDAHGFLPGVSARYVFALRGLQIVALDPADLHQVAGGDIGTVFDLIVGPAPPANR